MTEPWKYDEAVERGEALHDAVTTVMGRLVSDCETWCGMDAYEHGYDKPCDEHSCDNARGKQCSADELLSFIRNWIQTNL